VFKVKLYFTGGYHTPSNSLTCSDNNAQQSHPLLPFPRGARASHDLVHFCRRTWICKISTPNVYA